MNNLLIGRITIQLYMTDRLYQSVTAEKGDYFSDALDVATYGLGTAWNWSPMLKPTLIGAGVRGAAAAALWTTQVVLAPVALGYVGGAVIGTAISQQMFGDEGAQVALGFYSGGLLPGTEAPDLSDYQYIFKPTAPGGPKSLYDHGSAIVSGIKALGSNWAVKHRDVPKPRFYNL